MKKRLSLALGALLLISPAIAAEPGFTPLFNGNNLDGWQLIGQRGQGYLVQDGVIVCPKEGGGNLYTEKEFENFVFRFEFKLTENANNGVGLRAPLQGDPAYLGMELQILHDDGPQYRDKLRPSQYHGSIYDLVPAKRGSLKPPGEWNSQEIRADGRGIQVTLNGNVIVDADLNDIQDPDKLQKHPGILRTKGHIGFLGHGAHLEFRNIRIQELPSHQEDNQAPDGFAALFNGRNLQGWKGLLKSPHDNPSKRAALPESQRQELQAEANQNMEEHWNVEDGALVFDGKGRSLCTAKDYEDFEFHVDWKITSGGDSGIYLRGTPQVQIWDPAVKKSGSEVGSGGLYNNQKNPSKPMKAADHPAGEWNNFRILMTGEKVTVYLNNQLVTHNVTLENYWDRSIPIYPSGQIELQNHGDHLYFKNIYIREIKGSR